MTSAMPQRQPEKGALAPEVRNHIHTDQFESSYPKWHSLIDRCVVTSVPNSHPIRVDFWHVVYRSRGVNHISRALYLRLCRSHRSSLVWSKAMFEYPRPT